MKGDNSFHPGIAVGQLLNKTHILNTTLGFVVVVVVVVAVVVVVFLF